MPTPADLTSTCSASGPPLNTLPGLFATRSARRLMLKLVDRLMLASAWRVFNWPVWDAGNCAIQQPGHLQDQLGSPAANTSDCARLCLNRVRLGKAAPGMELTTSLPPHPRNKTFAFETERKTFVSVCKPSALLPLWRMLAKPILPSPLCRTRQQRDRRKCILLADPSPLTRLVLCIEQDAERRLLTFDGRSRD